MTGNKCYLTDFEAYDGGFVFFGDGKGRIFGKGKIKTGKLDFDDVYFYKGIKREFSVSRTPQQNWVTERRNRTLIEAARIMLVDSKLPTIFWAEAVNTACYVLNRALVTKPHNKTLYELIRRRPSLIDFMKSFGCPVTILNTRDNLGKFEGKADEGYFVGYSVVIVAGNQTNGIVGSKENLVAGQNDMKKELEQEYILIPICTTDSLLSQGFKDSTVDAGTKAPEVDESEASDNDRKNDQVLRSEVEGLPQQARQTENINSPNSFNTVSSHVNTFGSSFVNAASQTPINAAGPSADDTCIFGNAYDDEVLEEEVDMNNVDSSYTIPEATKDYLGKLNEKVDEGFFVGYSVVPVVTRFQTNGIVGTKDNIVAGQAKKKKDPEQEYIMISICTTDPLISQGLKDSAVDAGKKATEVIQVKFQIMVGRIQEEHPFERFSPFKNAFSLPHVPIMTPINDTGIFGNAYDDEAVEEEFDLKNVVSSYTIHVASVTKFLKDYPKDQVIGTSTPMESNKPLIKDEEAEDVDVNLYRSMIGSLMYLTASRPDITFVVCVHMQEAYSDRDYARASLDSKFTTGGCQFLGKRLISWQCKKQIIFANSTTEAEYVVAVN
nr:ribonuclease H-like domain-containing protein [Tanacetum cinerariifolium]